MLKYNIINRLRDFYAKKYICSAQNIIFAKIGCK